MDSETKSRHPQKPPAEQSDASVDEFFNQLQSDMRRPDVSQEDITAAFNAIQQLALETDSGETATEEAVPELPPTEVPAIFCPGCGRGNPPGSRYCASCGGQLQGGAGQPSPGPRPGPAGDATPGEHHYHHHYHHHYFAPGQGLPATFMAPAQAAAPAVPGRDSARLRTATATGSTGLTRAEAAVRRMAQDWVQACNTKHLDDLVELYIPDALLLRPNIPAVRGTAAIREFFFAALDAGLGDVELDTLRVELFGDFAYEAGRCKMLVPVAVGKRREERGKYVILLARQPAGDWKIMLDSWSSDLSLAASNEAAVKPGLASAQVGPRTPRR